MEKTYQKHIISQSVVFQRHHKTSVEELLKCWKGLKHVHTCRKLIYHAGTDVSNRKHFISKSFTVIVFSMLASDPAAVGGMRGWHSHPGQQEAHKWCWILKRRASDRSQTHLVFSHHTPFTHKQPLSSQSLCIINGNMTLLDNLSAFGGQTALLCHAGFTSSVCLCLVCALVSQYSEVFPVPNQPEGSLSFHHTSFGCTEICRWILLGCVLNKLVKVPLCPPYHKREKIKLSTRR